MLRMGGRVMTEPAIDRIGCFLGKNPLRLSVKRVKEDDYCTFLCFREKKEKKVSIRNRYRRIYFRNLLLTERGFDGIIWVSILFRDRLLRSKIVGKKRVGAVKYLVSQYLRGAWISRSRLKEELAVSHGSRGKFRLMSGRGSEVGRAETT